MIEPTPNFRPFSPSRLYTRIYIYKLTGRPAHDGLAQVDYSGRRSGALLCGSGARYLRGQPRGLFCCGSIILSTQTLANSRAAADCQWADSVLGSRVRACGVRLCSDRCAWDAGRRFLSWGDDTTARAQAGPPAGSCMSIVLLPFQLTKIRAPISCGNFHVLHIEHFVVSRS